MDKNEFLTAQRELEKEKHAAAGEAVKGGILLIFGCPLGAITLLVLLSLIIGLLK